MPFLKSKCRSCGQDIMWVKTKTGKNMPIDYDQKLEYLFNDGKPVEFDFNSMLSHFVTCKDSDKWRK